MASDRQVLRQKLEAADRALAANPRDLRARIAKGDALTGLGDTRGAASFYTSALRLAGQAQGLPPDLVGELRRVQAATEIGFGPQTGDDLLLQVRSSDARLRELVSFIAEDLTCQVTWKGEEAVEG